MSRIGRMVSFTRVCLAAWVKDAFLQYKKPILDLNFGLEMLNLLSVGGSILIFGWKTYPNETAYFSGPEYAYNCQIGIENSKVSKTVKILSVSVTELMLLAKTWGKSNLEVTFFLKALCSIDIPLNGAKAGNQIPFPMASPWCEQSLDSLRLYFF